MRIIAGHLKGRGLAGPSWDGLRPTSDSLRETLFNVLGPTLDGAAVLDAFAGTGALGLEALSRGAARVTFIERDRRALALLRENIQACAAGTDCAVLNDDVARAAARLDERFDLLLFDPPYDMTDIPAVLDAAARLAKPGARIVVEHGKRTATPESGHGLTRTRLLVAGDSALSFYAAIQGTLSGHA